MLFAAHLSRDVLSGFESVSEERGLKIVGWYETMQSVSEAMASSATAVVRLFEAWLSDVNPVR